MVNVSILARSEGGVLPPSRLTKAKVLEGETHVYFLADPDYIQVHVLRSVALPAIARNEWNADSGSRLKCRQGCYVDSIQGSHVGLLNEFFALPQHGGADIYQLPMQAVFSDSS
jgi:hypothetical protein